MDKELMRKIIKSIDYPLMIVIFMLCIFGLIMVYSSSMISAVVRYGVPSDYFYQRQKLWLIVAAIVYLIALIVPYKALGLKKPVKIIFWAMPIALMLVAVIGHTANNATSWFKLGFFNIQPAEFVKLGLIVYLASVYANKQKSSVQSSKGKLFPVYYTLFICFLVTIQPDYGTAGIIFLIALCVVLSSGLRFGLLVKQFLFLVFLAVVTSPVWYFLMGDEIFSEERRSRISGFLDPFKHADDDGFQLVNSYLAIGSGGVKGLGLGESIQKYGYLPESHTDFIMAIIAEELGLFGVSFVLFLLAYIVLKGMVIGRKCRDPFGSLLAIGISSMIGIQTCINLGGLTGLIPITGVPLPLISYGGSSLLLLMLSLGILSNISMFVKYEQLYKEPSPKVEQINNRGLTL